MSFGVALRNAVSIGLGGIATLFSGTIDNIIEVYLRTIYKLKFLA